MSHKTVADRIQAHGESLTRAERQLVDTMLENYPVSALGTITSLAEAAEVSTPTVARLVQKLGFRGFPDFQAALRQELEDRISSPITKHDTWAEQAPEGHILNRFTEAVISNISQTLANVDIETFERTVALLSDPHRALFVVGGRITRSLADYFFLHMQMVRSRVTLMQSTANAWPHYFLELKSGDVVVIFDIRRYENSTLKLAEMAHEMGARIVLFTDQWRSPVHRLADICFSCRISVPSAWDSSVANLLLLETVIAAVQEKNWSEVRGRIDLLEDIFDRTRFFRKFT